MTLPEAIKCDTPEEAAQIRQLLHRQGHAWVDNTPAAEIISHLKPDGNFYGVDQEAIDEPVTHWRPREVYPKPIY